MKFLSHIPSPLKNKFVIAGSFFLVWMLFFDVKDVVSQFNRRNELKDLQKSKEYYNQQIAQEQQALRDLKSDPSAIEKYAREKYLMKRDNEDIFIIQQPSENK